MTAQHFTITGRVHGVGFRYAMAIEARRLQLGGWVRNRRDGSVEAVAAGAQAELDRLAQWMQRGPPAAEVRHVKIRTATEAEAADAGDSFEQRQSA